MSAIATATSSLAFLEQFSGFTPIQHAARESAVDALAKLDFPTIKAEAWKYTRVGKLVKANYRIENSTNTIDLASYVLESADAIRLVFVNGFYRADLSKVEELPAGLTIEELSENNAGVGTLSLHQEEVFSALNTALTTGGASIHVASKAIIDTPIHLINLTDGANVFAQPRLVVKAEASSKVQLIQSFHSTANADQTFTNNLTEIYVSENADVTLEKIQYEGTTSSQISTEQVYQCRDSRFHIDTLTLNGALVRNNLNIVVDGEHCETNLNGLYLPKGKQHIDNHTMVDHKVAHCESNEMYKGIIDDQGAAVFNGKVFVRPDAQKINAFQNNANILMSTEGTINSKPELEIYADDVKCSHGSTTGQFDEEAVFYLRARGIGEKSARRMLVSAFAGEVLDEIKIEAVREKVDALLAERFNWNF